MSESRQGELALADEWAGEGDWGLGSRDQDTIIPSLRWEFLISTRFLHRFLIVLLRFVS